MERWVASQGSPWQSDAPQSYRMNLFCLVKGWGAVWSREDTVPGGGGIIQPKAPRSGRIWFADITGRCSTERRIGMNCGNGES